MKPNRKNNKTLSAEYKCDYILFMTFWMYVGAFVVYYANLKLAECMSPRQGFWVAIEFLVVTGIITYFMTRSCLSQLQGFFSILIGLESYTFFIYWKTLFVMCSAFIGASIIVATACLVLYFATGTRKQKTLISYCFSRFIDSFYMSRMLSAIIGCVACIVLPISYRFQVNQVYTIGAESIELPDASIRAFADSYREDILSTGGAYSEEQYRVVQVYGDEYRLDSNIDRIKPIANEAEWESLSLTERQDTIIAILECEARYLGIPYQLTIRFSNEMQYEIKGFYSHSNHLICINNKALQKDGGHAALITALEEIRHCYQHALCDAYVKLTPEERNLYCFYGVDEWCMNFTNYIDGRSHYAEYQEQPIEAEAHSYAVTEAAVYIRRINSSVSSE